MQLDSMMVAVIALVCYFVLPLALILTIKNIKTLKIVTRVLAVVYAVILVIGVWSRVSVRDGVVNISFDYSQGFLSKEISWGFSSLSFVDVALNLVMLIPVGIIFSVLSPEPIKMQLIWSFVIGLSLGIIIELGQFMLPVRRSVQLSDVLFNTLSVILGVFTGKFMLRLKELQLG